MPQDLLIIAWPRRISIRSTGVPLPKQNKTRLIAFSQAVVILNQLSFLKIWPLPLLLFPPFAYERCLTLMLMGQAAPGGELHKALLINLASGSALFAIGAFLDPVSTLISRPHRLGTQGVLRALLRFPDRHRFVWAPHTKGSDSLETRVPSLRPLRF